MKPSSRSAADAGGVVGPEVVAACALSAVPGLGATSLARIAQTFGSLVEALQAGPARIFAKADALGLRQPARDFLARKPDLDELGRWAVSAAKTAGARVVLLADPWYPALLRQIENPPPLLYVRGTLDADVRRVALVGARDCDDYGLELAKSLGEGLAQARVQVVSGGARGVDAAAHAGALWGAGSTVAVLGCGIDIVYPPENAELFDRLAKGGGAVVSEFAPGTPSAKPNFPRRNRTISGLSSAVVVVRAAQSSGALITADHAARQQRPIFAVPGDATQPLSAGPNELLKLGVARAVTSAADLLRALGWPPAPEKRSARPVPARREPERSLVVAGELSLEPVGEPVGQPVGERTDHQVIDEVGLKVWRALDTRTPLHVDELAGRLGLPSQEVLRALADLELKGMCLQRPGKYFLRKEP